MFRRIIQRNQGVRRRTFATTAFTNTKKRFDDLKKTLPNLFDAAKIAKEQQTVIDAHFKPANLDKAVAAWNARVDELKALGVRFHYGIGQSGKNSHMEGHAENQPGGGGAKPEHIFQNLTKPKPIVPEERDWAAIDKNYTTGAELVKKIAYLGDYVDQVFDHNDGPTNLKLAEANDVFKELEAWRLKIEMGSEWQGHVCPVDNEEVTDWCDHYRQDQMRKPMIGDPSFGSNRSVFIDYEKMAPEHVAPVQNFIKERDEIFFNTVVLARDPTVDRARWDRYNLRQNEMFHYRDQTQYQWDDLTKDLFRMAVWESDAQVEVIEKEMIKLCEFLKRSSENETDIKRKTYEDRQSLPFRAEVAQELQTRDPLHVSKILDEIRILIDESTFEKGIREVLADHYAVFFEADRKGNQRGIDRSVHKEEADRHEMKDLIGVNVPKWTETAEVDIFRNRLKDIDVLEAKFNAEPMTLEAAVDEVIPRALWMRTKWDVHKPSADPREAELDGFKKKVIDYCKGKGKLADLNAAYWALMPQGREEQFTGPQLGPEDNMNMVYFCQYFISREANVPMWDIHSVMSTDEWSMIDKCYAMEGNLKRIRLVQKILREHGFSPMIQNFVKHLINVEACHLIPDISVQMSEILKRFKGEMHGTVRSAQPLSDAQFKSVTEALHKANPGKKFFLHPVVDTSLMGGFVVKIGIQTLDFSLLSEVEAFKKQAISER